MKSIWRMALEILSRSFQTRSKLKSFQKVILTILQKDNHQKEKLFISFLQIALNINRFWNKLCRHLVCHQIPIFQPLLLDLRNISQ